MGVHLSDDDRATFRQMWKENFRIDKQTVAAAMFGFMATLFAWAWLAAFGG